jgi:hypothetical protein
VLRIVYYETVDQLIEENTKLNIITPEVFIKECKSLFNAII